MEKTLCFITKDFKIVFTFVVRDLKIVYIHFSITKNALFNYFFHNLPQSISARTLEFVFEDVSPLTFRQKLMN